MGLRPWIRRLKFSKAVGFRQIERSEWSLSWAAIAVTLLLTAGIASFAWEMLHSPDFQNTEFGIVVRGLTAAVLLFDIYVIYQQTQLHRIRRHLLDREALFKLITENVADMIAVVDGEGHRLYNSPSYFRVMGYTSPTTFVPLRRLTRFIPTIASLSATSPMKRAAPVSAAASSSACATRTGTGFIWNPPPA